MTEKVNPAHPDKIADRIAGAIVDYAYSIQTDPKIAVEVLIGHGKAFIIIESSVRIFLSDVKPIVARISGISNVTLVYSRQDSKLSQNQDGAVRCGDNGIFKGMPLTNEEKRLSLIAHEIYEEYPSDGKYILDDALSELIICQSNVSRKSFDKKIYNAFPESALHFIIFDNVTFNPLGEWTGGLDVDTGATNRKLGSDMGHSVTGGGLHGKDLSKADVSINIYAFAKAQELNKPVELFCAIGDEYVDGKPYSEIVEFARNFIKERGGFEKFAEWGLF